MANPPPSKYKIDDLCSISIGKKIFEITLHGGLFDVPTVERILKKIDEYVGGKEYLTMINCEKSARTTIKALRRMSHPSALQYSIAKAYVIHTLHQRFMANVYLFLFRPKKPVKFFVDEELARQWLEDLVIF
jgi:hypothetical protein